MKRSDRSSWDRTSTPTLRLDEGLFELPGNEPLWIWAHTCSDRRCNCREALILTTDESRDSLLMGGLPVREAWQAGTGYIDVAAKLEKLTPFLLDIDTVTATDLDGHPLNLLDVQPRIAVIVDRMDGEVLDSIDMLWYTGKGYPDQREMVLATKSFKIPHWHPGKLIAYSSIFRSIRSDLYYLSDQPKVAYEALEAYCINPACACGDVSAMFYRLEARGESHPIGMIEVNLSGAIVIKPEPGEEETLDRLWIAFRKRYPAYLARFTRRDADMKCIGKKTEELNPRTKIGRNDSCPCGSGKKYKKCCGAETPH